MQNLLVSDDMSNKSWFDYEIVKLGSNNHMRDVVVYVKNLLGARVQIFSKEPHKKNYLSDIPLPSISAIFAESFPIIFHETLPFS